MNLEIGTQLGDYRIVSRIGQGAYGVVYEAEHVITRRIDAIKLLHDPGSADDEHRFLQEIQVQARLQHPNIATVYTAFRTQWGLALVMEKVPGEPLGAILRRGRPPLSEGVRYILSALSALSCAEQAGIVHRDLKPDNILITPQGEVKITDFGLAQIRGGPRITSSGDSLGTPCYMAPEQVVGTNPVDARTDVYSAGVVLYEILTGRPPFEASNGFAVMLAHQNTTPAPPVDIEPSIGAPLSQAIMTALEKSPERRFQNAAEFYHALMDAMPANLPVASVPPPASASYARIALLVAAVSMFMGGLVMWAARATLQKHTAVARPAPSLPVTPVVERPVPRDPAPPEPAPEASDPAPPRPAAEAHAPVSRQVRRRRARMEQAMSLAAGREAAPENHPPVRGVAPEIKAPAPASPQPIADLPHQAPPPPEPPSVSASAPAQPTAKKPGVLKRTLFKIIGKHPKPDTSEGAASPVKPD